MLVDTVTGELRQARIVTGVDDHSGYCVLAKVVERATGRAVCLAFSEALARYGAPEEVLSDNGIQFTARFARGGEVLFDKICRKNGITHRLTAPASPNQNGKVERFHGTFRPDFLDQADPFVSIEQAQAAVDTWVGEYNTDRPHQALDEDQPVVPADRFEPVPDEVRVLIDLWLPPSLGLTDTSDTGDTPSVEQPASSTPLSTGPVAGLWSGGAIEFDRVVPASGNMWLAGKQLWLGPARAGQTVRFWADCELIHLLVGGARVKTVRSHLSVNDLAHLVAHGAVPATSASPLPAIDPETTAVEIERTVSPGGIVSLGGRQLLAAEILGGRRVGIRIETATLMFFDLDTRELLRTRPNPLTADQVQRLRGLRPAGPPPRPSVEPIRVQRRASNTGVIMIAGQKVALGRAHQHETVSVLVSETTLAVQLDDGDTRVVRRTTTQPVRHIKGQRPRTASAS
jgi:hypothetical protein